MRAWVLAIILAAGAAPAWAVCRDSHGHFAKCGAGGVEPVISSRMAKIDGERAPRAPHVRKPRAPRAPNLFGKHRRR